MKADELSREDKEKIVHYFMKCYRQAKTNIEYMEECELVSEKIEEYRSEKKTCLLIQQALMEMDGELKDILLMEFLDKRPAKEILEKYSRSSYYRLRNLAVDDFLRCL